MFTYQTRMLVLLMAVLLPFMTSLSYAQGSGNKGELAQQGIEFMKRAAVGGKLEIQLAKVAQKRAQHDEVRQFGQRMEEDHTKAAQKLKKPAANLNVQLYPLMSANVLCVRACALASTNRLL
jgi:predicted outer membrane protein